MGNCENFTDCPYESFNRPCEIVECSEFSGGPELAASLLITFVSEQVREYINQRGAAAYNHGMAASIKDRSPMAPSDRGRDHAQSRADEDRIVGMVRSLEFENANLKHQLQLAAQPGPREVVVPEIPEWVKQVSCVHRKDGSWSARLYDDTYFKPFRNDPHKGAGDDMFIAIAAALAQDNGEPT